MGQGIYACMTEKDQPKLILTDGATIRATGQPPRVSGLKEHNTGLHWAHIGLLGMFLALYLNIFISLPRAPKSLTSALGRANLGMIGNKLAKTCLYN